MADAAFNRQLVALLPRLRRFAYGLTGSIEEGDDLVQTACERALAAADRFERGTRLDSWLYRILQNAWIDGVRRRRRGDVGLDPRQLDAYPGGDAAAEAEARLTLMDVRRAVAELAPEQRAVLILVSVEGVAYREAAEILGLPIGTVMSRLGRARLALGRALEAPPREAGNGNVVKLRSSEGSGGAPAQARR
jgi:RNA polymerase sigma-70 factor (ECF subfamily)